MKNRKTHYTYFLVYISGFPDHWKPSIRISDTHENFRHSWISCRVLSNSFKTNDYVNFLQTLEDVDLFPQIQLRFFSKCFTEFINEFNDKINIQKKFWFPKLYLDLCFKPLCSLYQRIILMFALVKLCFTILII